MKYTKFAAVIAGIALFATPALAAVTVSVEPTSPITTTKSVGADSDDFVLFEFALTEDNDEVLESVTVLVEKSGTTDVSEEDLGHLSLYKDEGDKEFDEDMDEEIVSVSDVNIGTETVLEVEAEDGVLDGELFFVTLSTDESWGTDDIQDKITVTLDVDGIVTSSDSPELDEVVMTDTIVSSASNDDDEDEDEDEVDEEIGNCTNGLKNGRLYKLSEGDTVYLAAACRLKPFRGAAAFHARGHKFQNITVLSSTSGITVDTKPALPAGGTLVKGTDATVYIVTKQGKRKGFVSANAFARLGFKFEQVQQITDSDLSTMEVDTPVTETDDHPDGTVAKCGNSAAVFEVKNGSKHPFTSAPAFELRGHSWTHIAVIDCGRFAYLEGETLNAE